MKKTNDNTIAILSNIGLDMTPKGAGYSVGAFFNRKNISVSDAAKKMVVSHYTI